MTDEDRVFAKCTARLLPFMVLLFTVNFLDRVNVSFAALTMNKDLGFSPSTYGFGAGIFFAGYVAFQIPSNIMLARVGARRWIFMIMLVWGLISAATSLTQDAASFFVFRFLLGVAEAGLFPGLIYYISLWFPHAYRGSFAAAIIAAAPLANVFGGPLSSFILGMEGVLGFHGWQWLFLIEGLPACALAFAVFAVMPDAPQEARWLSADEKRIVAARVTKEDTGEKRDLWSALCDVRVLILSLAAFGIQSGLFGIGLWLPQMVQAMGFSAFATGFIIVPPYALSAIAMILWGRSSDRRDERSWHLASAAVVGAAGLIAASMLHDAALELLALTVAVVGIESTFGPFWGFPSKFLGGMGAAGGIALVNSIGSFSGFVMPYVIGILKERTGDYASSMILLAVAMLSAAIVSLVMGRMTSQTVRARLQAGALPD